ncbi:transmembrane protein 267 [Euwallacea fornicatus]|uniref:transmembrane protein 267 n=1 Tax=Euwallacea fornicatus TaxID=995702 RepID=UPI00338FACFD
MKLVSLVFNLNTYLTAGIAAVAIAGDHLVTLCGAPFLKALSDNLTHAVIGGLSWSICYFNRQKSLAETRYGFIEILSCTVLSSLIDLDHFLSAKSLSLKDATALNHRPIFHCSTFALIIYVFLTLLSFICESLVVGWSALIVFTAFATHHIRDAHRRGLWFYPYGSTAPISYTLYIVITCLLPYIVMVMERMFRVPQKRDVNDYLYAI